MRDRGARGVPEGFGEAPPSRVSGVPGSGTEAAEPGMKSGGADTAGLVSCSDGATDSGGGKSQGRGTFESISVFLNYEGNLSTRAAGIILCLIRIHLHTIESEDKPCGSANHAISVVLFLYSCELEVDELGNVADKGKNFPHAVVD